MVPRLIIHGGAGRREGGHVRIEEYSAHLVPILQHGHELLAGGYSAREVVLEAIRRLEDDPIFNAGTGSRLQRDGEARMSAAIADSASGEFCGVINIQRVRHPIDVADRLSTQRHTVLAGEPATRFARDHGFPPHDPITPHRLQEHRTALDGDTGTVGAVALDAGGSICAATSTGGVGFETPGRVGDSATVAGTYATRRVGISCTGKGEQIVNLAVAARVATRVEDGASLAQAVRSTLSEAARHGYQFGLIALGCNGDIIADQVGETTTLYAAHDGSAARTYLDDPN